MTGDVRAGESLFFVAMRAWILASFFQGDDGARQSVDRGFFGVGFFEIIALGDLPEDVTADFC